MHFHTSGNLLDVAIQPIWTERGNVKFMISFLDKGNNTLVPQVKYDAVITTFDANKTTVVYDATSAVVSVPMGEPLSLYTANGTAMVPDNEEMSPLKLDSGSYVMKIVIYGIRSTPIEPQTVQVPFQVTPEFPSVAFVAGTGGIMVVVIMTFARVPKLSIFR
jgi:hypothetical protein